MKKEYYPVEWKGPGFYREVRVYSVNQCCYMELQKVGNLDDAGEEDAAWRRRKGWKVWRAKSEQDLPEATVK